MYTLLVLRQISYKSATLHTGEAKMRISDVIGLLSAFIGSTATLFGAWAYIRSQHPSKGELLRAALVIIVMMAAVAGLAMGISRATTFTVNGRDSIPVRHPFSKIGRASCRERV